MRVRMRVAMVVAAAALGLMALALAACNGGTTRVTLEQAQQTGIAVTGTGKVSTQQDIAQLHIGVEVARPTVAAARTEAAAANQALRDALTKRGVAEKDIATQFFNIQPQYLYKPDALPAITGYTVSNQLSVKVRNLDTISQVLDDAIAAGGNAVRVNGLTFTVDKPEQYLERARAQAMADARARAEQLATLAGVRLGKVRSVSESTAAQPPVFELRSAPATGLGKGGDTPVSPGESEITLSVSVVYDIE